MTIVVALGGNAVTGPGEPGDIPHQFQRTYETVAALADLIVAGERLVITHGNGPQVGNALRRVEIARRENVYPLPMHIAVADVQGGMGYMICQCVMNQLAARGHPRVCATIVTTVRVDPNDPAFDRPTKPIGPFLTAEQAALRGREDGWCVMDDLGRGWRRVVPSPLPRDIVELPVIRALVDAGELVVACGGGGVAVVADGHGRLSGVDAVIDKDRTSALLAAGLDADRLYFLTGEEHAMLNYGRPTQRAIDQVTTSQAREWLAQGQFPEGSMGPKIEAAIGFVETSRRPGALAVITSHATLAAAHAGQTGTRIVRG